MMGTMKRIIMRSTAEFFKAVEEKSKEIGLTISGYIRSLVMQDLGGSFCDKVSTRGDKRRGKKC